MGLKQQIDADLKASLLAGDKTKATVLRGLKSAILYAELAQGVKEVGLDENGILTVLGKESKKIQESIVLYRQGGDEARVQKESDEKQIVDAYLPAQATDDDIDQAIDEAMSGLSPDQLNMGLVIGKVKQKLGLSADGGRIAAKVKQKLG